VEKAIPVTKMTQQKQHRCDTLIEALPSWVPTFWLPCALVYLGVEAL